MWWTVSGAIVLVGAFVSSPTIVAVPSGGIVFAAVVPAAVVLATTVPYLRYRRWRYEIRERDLFL
jgi:membrane protein YdbS with pleckstrin-like domain